VGALAHREALAAAPETDREEGSRSTMDHKEGLVPGTIKGTAEAVEGVLKAVPIYQDLAQPAVREVGAALQDAVRLALTPLSLLVWGYDKVKDYLEDALAERLEDLPSEQIITPSPIIAGPALDALRYAGHDPKLRELYANLLATAMDANRVREAHPAFVEIIRQLTSDEARILALFAERNAFPIISLRAAEEEGDSFRVIIERFSTIDALAQCRVPELLTAYIDNICRLGLAYIPEDFSFSDAQKYAELENHPVIKSLIEKIVAEGRLPKITQSVLRVSTLGRQFCKACVSPGRITPPPQSVAP
jgi:hypothetical protein